MLPWVGIGFLALGAACTKPTITEAALPFDKRRCGMLLGAGAVGLVLETDSSAASSRPGFAKGRPPLATVRTLAPFEVMAALSPLHLMCLSALCRCWVCVRPTRRITLRRLQ